MMDEKDYEEQIKALEKRNQKLLDVFHDDLCAAGNPIPDVPPATIAA